ncbi:MAG: hypothetical protein KIS61_35340 [Candidatus Eremiobacteraeota bacterium]|nr:hypothetical protein [Candidatus Eremiobacteraeota bacterium]
MTPTLDRKELDELKARVDLVDLFAIPGSSHARKARTGCATARFMMTGNAPDLSKPAGQADLVLLHLLYQDLSTERCRILRLDHVDELPDDQALQLALSRYLKQGRPAQMQFPNLYVLLGARGPFQSVSSLPL